MDYDCVKNKINNTDCIDTTWTQTGNSRCNNNTSQLEEISNCMNLRWVSGGNACEQGCNSVWVDVTPAETICTGSDLYKKQIDGCGKFRYTLSEANFSGCTGCTPSWVDKAPLETNCVKTGEFSIRIDKKQVDGCGNERWIEQHNITWENSFVDCDGSTSTAHLEVNVNIPMEFAVDNGSGNFTWVGDNTNNYDITGLAKDGSVVNFKARPVGYSCMFAGLLKLCDNTGTCTPTTWTPTGVADCINNVSSIQEISNCGTSRWVAGGNACTQCNDPQPSLSITANTSNICGLQVATLTAVTNSCGDIKWYRKVSNGADIQIGSGTSVSVNSGMTIYATCSNCNLALGQSNDIVINYTSQCSAECISPTFDLAATNPTCDSNWNVNSDGRVNIVNLSNADKFAVFPNCDGTGVVNGYAQAAIISNGIIAKDNINQNCTVKVRVYNGSDSCYIDKTINVVAPNCLDNCTECTNVSIAATDESPEVAKTITYTATGNGSAPFTYQWKLNGTAITNATGPTYEHTFLQGEIGNHVLSVEVTNCKGNGSATGTKNLTVEPKHEITNLVASNSCS